MNKIFYFKLNYCLLENELKLKKLNRLFIKIKINKYKQKWKFFLQHFFLQHLKYRNKMYLKLILPDSKKLNYVVILIMIEMKFREYFCSSVTYLHTLCG